ncbi:MAG: exosortase-associated EpsI family protein, partial [Chthoniobacterales bacterium]|nr:exosortase-associated EpsI family protein [Chthoniobacterales bacterium]
ESLATLPRDLGDWKQISQDKPLDADIEHELGTDQYVFREYADERKVGAATIQQMRDLRAAILRERIEEEAVRMEKDWTRLYSQMRMDHPESVVNLAVTYYTGMVDTVAHVPDRCVVADGYEPKPSDSDYADWKISPAGGTMRVRFINYEDQTGARRMPRSIAYFFQVNGDYEASPLDVRRKLQNLLQRHGYYAKVEVMTLLDDRNKSETVMSDFLSQVVPAVEGLLPDWQAVVRGANAPSKPVDAEALTQR